MVFSYYLLMTSSTVSSLSLCFYLAFIINLLICSCASQVKQQSYLTSVDYDETFEAVVEEEEGSQVEADDIGKRALEIDEVSKKTIMLLVDKDKNINETYEHIKDYKTSKFKINDFIFRLQEKYEYTMCRSYLNAAKGVMDNYFTIPEDDLVNLPNKKDRNFKGDFVSRGRLEDKANDDYITQRRFRFFGEYCSVENEWYFWRDMFITAENDTIAIPKGIGIPGGGGGGGIGPIVPPISPNNTNATTTTTTTKAPEPNVITSGEYDYVQVPAGEMMKRFNEVWDKYKHKAICNPKYLLECNTKTDRCRCLTKGIGLPTIVTQRDEDEKLDDDGDTDGFFTTQYYEDLKENDKGEVKIHYGEYLHKQKCVVTANLPGSNLDIFITNPCDLFLPMIGLCRADCVTNASCRSVTEQEKEAMKTRSRRLDFYERIINLTLHEVYHQKCICDPGMICRTIAKESYGGATTVKYTLSSFRYHFFFLFQIIMTGMIANY